LDDVALANYFAGLETGPLDGGALQPDIARALCLTKTGIKHPDIGFREWVALPLLLATGFIVRVCECRGDARREAAMAVVKVTKRWSQRQ
jgi:hypothetical protein